MMELTFEWDDRKAEANFRKHRVLFEDAASVFGDPNAITIYDDAHYTKEERFVTIGLSMKGPLIVICHTDRGNKIRIISARKATAKERRQYEEGI
jgi:uncharacterized protein